MSAFKKSELRTDRFPQTHQNAAPIVRIDSEGVHYNGGRAVSLLKGVMFSVLALLLGLFPALASAAVTIPETGVDMDEWVTAAITGLGAIVVVVVGGYFAFKLIKLALRWVGRITG